MIRNALVLLLATACSLALAQDATDNPLDQYTADPKFEQKAKAVLEAPLPTRPVSAIVAARLARAAAFQTLGDVKNQLAELVAANEITEGRRSGVVEALAATLRQSGDPDEALRVRLAFLKTGAGSPAARAQHSAITAIYYAQRADFASAQSLLQDAKDFAQGITDRQAIALQQSRYLWAESILRANQGRYKDAEAAARAALDQHVTYMSLRGQDPVGAYRGYLEQNLASILLHRGKPAEAEWLDRQALERSIAVRGRDSVVTAQAATRLAESLEGQGRYREAMALVQEARKVVDAKGVGIRANAAGVYLAEARLQVLMGNWEQGAAAYAERQRRRAAALAGTGLDDTSGSINWGYALVRLGRAAEAIDMLRRLNSRTARRVGENHYNSLEERGFLAHALLRSGNREEAGKIYAATMQRLINANQNLEAADNANVPRETRLNWVLEGYMEFLTADAERPAEAAIAQAFRVADIARGSSVQRAISLAASRAVIGDPALEQLARREQDLGNEQSALEKILEELLTRPRDKQPAQVIAEMQKNARAKAEERARVREQMQKQFPNYARLVNPVPITLTDARKLLRPREVMLSVYSSDDASYVWAIRADQPTAFARVPLGRARIQAIVTGLRKALDVGEASLAAFPVFDTGLAHSLYSQLIGPVAASLAGAENLIVVAHGALGQLPFGTLPTAPVTVAPSSDFAGYRDVPWLAKQFAITQLPSVNALSALRLAQTSTRAPSRPFAGFGDPQFGSQAAPGATRGVKLRNLAIKRSGDPAKPAGNQELARLPELPDTADEIREIARVLKADGKDVMLGLEATETNVKTRALDDYRVVMFATHGLVPGDLDGLNQPALALTNPGLSKETGADGLLTLEEVLALKLNADWVVLSACNTAAADGSGSEAVSGLGRAFFYAGARSLLVSNWPVETVSARLLTTDIFRRQAADPALSRAAALREAMLALMQQRAEGPQPYYYAHPMFWAAFSLVGESGR